MTRSCGLISVQCSRSLMSFTRTKIRRQRSHRGERGETPVLAWEALQRETLWTDADLAEIVEALGGTSHQIVLAGPPGTGKTRVARAIARYLTDDTRVAGASSSSIRATATKSSWRGFVPGPRAEPDLRSSTRGREVHSRGHGHPRSAICPRHRRDESGESPASLRRVDVPAGISRRTHRLAVLPRISIAEQPAVHRHHEHRGSQHSEHRHRSSAPISDLRLPSRCAYSGAVLRVKRDQPCPGSLHRFVQLNEELQEYLDKHHSIGHTFFMANEMTAERLRSVWKRQIGL